MWEPVTTKSLDLYAGPGGDSMMPDVSKVTFIKEEKKGANKKYRIKDANGRVWVAKLGREARPETAACVCCTDSGYKNVVNYLVPTLTIPGKGTFKNVRLEARPDDVERIGEWKWQFGIRLRNARAPGPEDDDGLYEQLGRGRCTERDPEVGPNEHQYIVSDLGATFGKLGNNNLPIILPTRPQKRGVRSITRKPSSSAVLKRARSDLRTKVKS
jgi:hypothetical protein